MFALRFVAGLAAVVVLGLGAAAWRLSQGPIELNFIREHVQAELREARSGRPVGIESVELAWSREANALQLRAVGVTFEDSARQVLSRFDEAVIDLGALPFLMGRVSVKRADFSGGEISLTRKIDGSVHVAFGPPGSPADIIVPPPPPNETLEARVNRLLDGLREGFAPIGPGGRLESIGARGVRLSIVDDKGGGAWLADAASFQLARQGEALTLNAEARLEAAQGLAPAQLRVTTDTSFQSAIVEFGASDVRPRALLSPAALGPFAGLDAPLTATISIGLDRDAGITRLEGEATLGPGVAEMAGDQFELDGGSVRGRYDIESDELIIDQLQLAGDKTRINGEVRVRDASAILRAASDAPAAFNIALPALTLDVPGVFSAPVSLSDVQAVGTILSNERSITFSRLSARVDEAAVDASGRVYWAEAGADARMLPGVELNATVSGALHPQTVLRMWPIGLGEGARDYLSRALTGGQITDVTARLDVRPSDIAAGPWRNEAVDVRFNITGGEMAFISTMAPVVGARGSAVLRGNRFDLNVEEASINGLALSRGRIEIPRLKPSGAMVTISTHAEGEARAMLDLLKQEPLGLADRLPVASEGASGRVAMDLRFQRPTSADVSYEQLRFNIDGRIDDFGGTMVERRMALSRGRISVRGDQRSITISGPIRAGESSVNVQWTEMLGRARGANSQYQISGDFGADDLQRLGYPVAAFAQGRIGVVVSGDGRGFDVDDGNIQLDLRDAAIAAPRGFWTKRAGQSASASFDVVRGEDGGLVLSNINARGAGLVAQGEVRVSRDNRFVSAELSRLVVNQRTDARLSARRASDGGLDIAITGESFDAAPFMDNTAPAEARARGQAAPAPLRASVDVARLNLRGEAVLSGANVDLAVVRDALARLTASGRTPNGGAFSLGLGPRPDDPQGRIVLSSDDAGFAMRALTGADNIEGGTATAQGVWRGGPPSTAEFTVHLRDFQVVRLPAMARLLSSAGSLTGLVETLNGDGIGFTALDAPMVLANDRLSISEARAAGPSLGLTASGSYDLNANDLDIDGVVVPSYGLNSMLGAVPIFGDLLVSRRGEGVFGMTYSIDGAVAAPRVGVNPLSALTPGILRRIFEPLQQQETPAAPAQQPASRSGQRVVEDGPRATASLPGRDSRVPAP